MKYKIFIVEDDLVIRNLLCEYMDKYGFEVEAVHDFNDVLIDFFHCKADLILLDINLPKYDGFYWCKKIRQHSNIPIIFISAREGSMDQVMALESGADGYITKPFDIDVVIAKIKSFIRRTYGDYAPKEHDGMMEIKGLKYFPQRFEIQYQDKKIVLTQKEGILLEHLMKKFPKVVSRDFLIEKVWDDAEFIEDNTLNVNISRIRKRFEDLGMESVVETIRGKGYRLNKTW